jgi:hypothetical protein
MKRERIQQFHASPKAAKDYFNKSLTDPHSSIARDYSGMAVSAVRIAKNVGGQPNVPTNGRKLYNIYLIKRKK